MLCFKELQSTVVSLVRSLEHQDHGYRFLLVDNCLLSSNFEDLSIPKASLKVLLGLLSIDSNRSFQFSISEFTHFF